MIVLKMLSHYKVATDTVDLARVTPAVGMALADEILGERSGVTDAPNAVTHTYMSIASELALRGRLLRSRLPRSPSHAQGLGHLGYI